MTTHWADTYTGSYSIVLSDHATVEAGDLVEVTETCDDREWHDLQRLLAADGLDLRWSDWDAEAQINAYEVVAVAPRHEYDAEW